MKCYPYIMPTYSQLPRFLTLIFSVLLILTGSISAQGISSDMSQAQTAFKDGEFAKAQQLLAAVVTEYSGGAISEYGAMFGMVYYFKGSAELVLAQKADEAKDAAGVTKWSQLAIESFKTCYEKYSNAADTENKSTNMHHKLSLQLWANAAAISGDHTGAVKLFKKFIAEREDRDKYLPTPGTFYAQLATSYYLLDTPNIKEGNLFFGKALDEKKRLRTNESAVVKGFIALSDASVKTKDEKSLVDFIDKHRAHIILEPYRMNKYIPLFLNMANSAIKEKMFTTAYVLYGIIPNTTDVIDDMKTKLAQLPNRKGIVDTGRKVDIIALKKDLEKLEAKKTSGDPHEVPVLMGIAYLSKQTKNKTSVYAAFETLEEYYGESKHRESNLFNLINASSEVGLITKTAHYGQIFLEDYPESDKVPAVREKMLVSLFFGAEYEKSLTIANKLIDTLSAPSESHDICLFVKGGSHFYLGQLEEAKTYLDKHTTEYPNSKLAMHAMYFQGSNLTRLKEWPKATKILKSFLEKYPDPGVNNYFPNALYDLANCFYADSEYDEALTRLNRLEKDFSGSVIIDLAYNLKGNIYESTEKHADAEKYYASALEIAESKGHPGVAAESLNYLVGLLSSKTIGGKENTRMAEALPYYDKFLASYGDSQFKSQVVVFGLPAMQASGRGEEALDNIKGVIIETAGTERQFYLEESVNAYSEAFLDAEGNTPLMLKDVFYSLPIDLSNKKASALLRIAVISAYETELNSPELAENKQLKLRYAADIKSLFRDLKATFKPKDLTNYILIRIGDYLRTKTSAPKESVPYYEELLSRKDNLGQRNQALLGVADVMGNSTNPADKQKAIATLEEVVKDKENDKTSRAEALFRLTELYSEQNDWVNTEKNARQYLKEKNTKKAAIVSYLFALSFDKRNMKEDALFNYGQVARTNTGYLTVSAPATKRMLEIMWERNYPAGKVIGAGEKKITLEKSDRQSAYEEIGSRYLKRTSKIRKSNPKITEKEKEVWDDVAALVKKYEKSGSVKTLEQIKKEAGRRTR